MARFPLHRTHKYSFLALAAGCLKAATASAAIAGMPELPGEGVAWEAPGGYRITRHACLEPQKCGNGQTLEIRQAGKLLDHFDGEKLDLIDSLGAVAKTGLATVAESGDRLSAVRLTGPAQRDLIIWTHGKAEPPEGQSYDFISLDPTYARLAHATAGQGLPFRIVPLQASGQSVIEYQTSGLSHYWFQHGPYPWVSLAYDGHNYRLDPVRTRALNAKEAEGSPATDLAFSRSYDILEKAISLVYAGDGAKAAAMLQAAWPNIISATPLSVFPNADAMLQDLWCRVGSSDGGPEILQLSKLPVPSDCAAPAQTPYDRWMQSERASSLGIAAPASLSNGARKPLKLAHYLVRMTEWGGAFGVLVLLLSLGFRLWLNARFKRDNDKLKR